MDNRASNDSLLSYAVAELLLPKKQRRAAELVRQSDPQRPGNRFRQKVYILILLPCYNRAASEPNTAQHQAEAAWKELLVYLRLGSCVC